MPTPAAKRRTTPDQPITTAAEWRRRTAIAHVRRDVGTREIDRGVTTFLRAARQAGASRDGASPDALEEARAALRAFYGVGGPRIACPTRRALVRTHLRTLLDPAPTCDRSTRHVPPACYSVGAWRDLTAESPVLPLPRLRFDVPLLTDDVAHLRAAIAAASGREDLMRRLQERYYEFHQLGDGPASVLARGVNAAYDLLESFTTWRLYGQRMAEAFGALERLVATDPRQCGDLACRLVHEVLVLLHQAVTREQRTHASPTAEAGGAEVDGALLDAIAAAAAGTARAATLGSEPPISGNNFSIGPVLHTGDEIWAAAAWLIARAEHSVELSTWAWYSTSEAAKHVLGALASLQNRQAQRREAGQQVRPIAVTILVGSLFGGLGMARVSGGKLRAADPSQRVRPPSKAVAILGRWGSPQASFVVPFRVDPTLLHIRFHGHRRISRGTLHAKLLVVDRISGMICTANVKGSHHRASMHGMPLHDYGQIFAGPVATLMRRDFAYHAERTPCLLDNALVPQPPASVAELRASVHAVAHRVTPLPLADDVRQAIAAKIDQIGDDLHRYSCPESFAAPGRPMRLVALSKDAYHGIKLGKKYSPLRAAVEAALDGAQETLEIHHCYLNARFIVQALRRALNRGVEVSLLTTPRGHNRFYRVLGSSNLGTVRKLLRCAATVVRRPDLLRVRLVSAENRNHLFSDAHTKAMFVDRRVAVFGSGNFDQQSSYSAEFSLATDDPALVARMRAALFTGFWDVAQPWIDTPDDAVPGPLTVTAPGVPAPRVEPLITGLSIDSAARARNAAHPLMATPGPTSQAGGVGREGAAPQRDIRHPGVRPAPARTCTRPPKAARFVSAANLKERFEEARDTLHVAPKAAYMSWFNEACASLLRTEEAAFERLAMRHATLALPPEQDFHFAIERDLRGGQVRAYAPRYRISAEHSLVHASSGLRWAVYVPAAATPELGRAAAVSALGVFEGTAWRQDLERRRVGHPTGLRACVDPTGVGRRAFALHRDQLLDAVEQVTGDHGSMTLLGYSQGGAFACRLWAALPSHLRPRIQVITYNMPALDRATARALSDSGHPRMLRHIWVRGDIVPLAGEASAEGECWRVIGPRPYLSFKNHITPVLSDLELAGASLTPHVSRRAVLPWPAFEVLRWGVGSLCFGRTTEPVGFGLSPGPRSRAPR